MPSFSGISASDCCLVIAIPLTRCRFEEAQTFSDYLRGAEWSNYEPIARRTGMILDEAEQLGARVVRDGTLDRLRAAIEQSSALMIVAHCRYPPIDPDDILDLEALIDRIGIGEELEFDLLRAELQGLPMTSIAVAKCLEGIAARTRLHYASGLVDERRAIEMTGVRLLRDVGSPIRVDRSRLEELLGRSTFREAAAIEMADRMVTTSEFASAIAGDFDGVIDLSMCTSISAAMVVKRLTPKAGVLMSTAEIRPEVAATLFKAYAGHIRNSESTNPISYRDAVRRVEEFLTK